MALTERFENDKIEVVGQYKAIQVRRADIVERDGVEIARTFHRHVLHPGTLDADNNLVDTDISGEDADVQAICNAVWTQSVKDTYKAKLIADKTGGPGIAT
jgi:hypothetical protein|tara:strand:- start:24 stop:326 length:303 start_codon:yes stop_codon:yes gene_type:complete